jgi:mannitol/fructose-specific phosphotransferase system IIA component (Ntr-type)
MENNNMNLNEITSLNKVISKIYLNLEADNFEEALKIMLSRFDNEKTICNTFNTLKFNCTQARDLLFERESLFSTALGRGLAVPHCKLAGLKKMIGIMGIFKKGINYITPDNMPVYVVIILFSPLCYSGPHIELMAMLCEKFNQKNLSADLAACSSAKEIKKLLDMD